MSSTSPTQPMTVLVSDTIASMTVVDATTLTEAAS